MEEERVVVTEDVRGGDGSFESNLQNQNQSIGESDSGSGLGVPSSSSSSSSRKGKSCKGCLYYSSVLKSNSRSPLCVGVTRKLPQVPRYIVGESEMEASKEGRSLADFKYACVGYSVYTEKNHQSAAEDTQEELPVCMGLEVLMDRKVSSTDSVPAQVRSREDGHGIPQPRTPKITHSVGDEFLSRFSRNASLVATGVAKNMRRVGNRIKESIDDVLYPYRRRPK